MKTAKGVPLCGLDGFLLRRSQNATDLKFCDDYPEFMFDLSDTIAENFNDLQNMIDEWELCCHRDKFNEDKLNKEGHCINTCCSIGRGNAQKELEKLHEQQELFVM